MALIKPLLVQVAVAAHVEALAAAQLLPLLIMQFVRPIGINHAAILQPDLVFDLGAHALLYAVELSILELQVVFLVYPVAFLDRSLVAGALTNRILCGSSTNEEEE